MKIITQLVILTLSLLLVNADQYCDTLLRRYHTFRSKCSPANVTIKNCCDLTGFPFNSTRSAVYQIKSCTVPCEVSSFATVTVSNAATYCDMTTDGGGWIVIQRNKKDSVLSFNKNWEDYEKGFGDLNTEFWYGLTMIHCLTQRGQWEMRLDYQRNDKSWSYLHYNQFSVGNASEQYPLSVGGFTGVGYNQFMPTNKNGDLNGMKFSTPDKGGCAASYKSGWWYNTCYWININLQPPNGNNGNDNYLYTEMKIRPKDCIIR